MFRIQQSNPFVSSASQPISFDTGGGERTSNQSIGLTGGLLSNNEAYLLEDSPIAVSIGEIVEKPTACLSYGVLETSLTTAPTHRG